MMIDDSSTLPVPIVNADAASPPTRVSSVAQLAAIPKKTSGSPSRRARAPGAPIGST
jgi:hypothetical protein